MVSRSGLGRGHHAPLGKAAWVPARWHGTTGMSRPAASRATPGLNSPGWRPAVRVPSGKRIRMRYSHLPAGEDEPGVLPPQGGADLLLARDLDDPHDGKADPRGHHQQPSDASGHPSAGARPVEQRPEIHGQYRSHHQDADSNGGGALKKHVIAATG